MIYNNYIKESNKLEITSWSPRAEEIFEWKASEVLGKSLYELNLIFPEDIEAVREYIILLTSGTMDRSKISNRNHTKSRTKVLCHWYNSVLKDSDGNIISILSFVEDITSTRSQENRIRKSEASLQEAQRIAKIGSWDWDPETDETFWSDEMFEVLGRTKTAQFKEAETIFSPEDWKKVSAALAKTIEDGTPYTIQCFIECPNGDSRWIETSGTRKINPHSGKIKVNGTIQNINDRKLSEIALLESQTNLNIILESLRDSIILLDKDFKILHFNNLAKDIVKNKYPNADFRIGNFLNKEIPADKNSNFYSMKGALKSKQPVSFEVLVNQPDGQSTTWMSTTYPLLDENNELKHILIRLANINEERRLQQEKDFESANKLALINSTSDFMWSVDKEFRLITANKAFSRAHAALQLDTLAVDLKMFSSNDIYTKALMPEWQNAYLRALDGESYTCEIAIPKDGNPEQQILEASFNPISENNEIIGVACFARNITARKVQERKLAEATFFLQRAQEVAHIGHWIYNIESPGQELFCSEETLEILGMTNAENNGTFQDYFGRVHPDDLELTEHHLTNLITKGISTRIEIRLRRKDNQRYTWVEIQSEISTLFGNENRAMIGVIKDINDRMLAQQEIQDLNTHLERKVAKRTEELEIANKELEAFSYSVSHDLRAPLRAIHGYSNIIDEEFHQKLDPEILRLLGLVKANAKQMGQLIDDLLDFSRLGKKDMQMSSLDMNDELDKSIKEVITGIDHHAKFIVQPLQPALADSKLINRVLCNLLSNALKYSSKKENPVIKISSIPHKHFIEYIIQDNGAGFDMNYATKLFGVFQRLHSTTDFHGTGVGLAIVQRIIKKHGGLVWAEGKVNQGAIFHFTLPSLP